MTYSALEDRPNACEGCSKADYPSANGPSTRQITWNAVLGKWMCCECQLSWSKAICDVSLKGL